MRVHLEFVTKNKMPLVLNIHKVNEILQGFIYRNLENERIKEIFHEKGVKDGPRKFKFFSFSRISSNRIRKFGDNILFESPFWFFVSSSFEEFIRGLVGGLEKNELLLGNSSVFLKKRDIFSWENFSQEFRGKTLSPIVVRGKDRIFYSPGTKEFTRLIINNLRRKVRIFYGVDDVDFDLVSFENVKKIPLYFKNRLIIAWGGDIHLKGDELALRMAYDTGLGIYNSMGFGMIGE